MWRRRARCLLLRRHRRHLIGVKEGVEGERRECNDYQRMNADFRKHAFTLVRAAYLVFLRLKWKGSFDVSLWPVVRVSYLSLDVNLIP